MSSIRHVDDLPAGDRELCLASLEARGRAYMPYSKFAVGAALRTADGTVVTGCNVENASYGLTICAERTACVKAVSEGHREFVYIAIAADLDTDFATPCGACRQFLSEFNHEIPILLVKSDHSVKLTSLAQLLPDSFTPKRLNLHFFKN